ncbi:hypothetical protein C7974DRAFT_326055 [Boeremia exigua]|uniref:uncharacterized protein n=1 Tax=Boeremia exigua TaxID=749465 RepID=UPI001E8CF166|nr:uncharacterized protein C7974DRAFT_326055 [Boeremia exigua]KAH6644489.1 hypothetical protein C7974DRAFT_326055 [Boeremia exigua]
MANLLSLPLELLVHVSSFVSTSDLGALRLTCKQTEKSLYEWFADEFFVKKQFMLTQPSLQVLLDISRHVSLSKKLKHLIIATNVYDDVPIRFRDADACSRYMQGYADQKALLENGIDREMLTASFRGLTSLETVDVRDFSAPRERDGTCWASWGATTVYKETGVRLRESYRGTGLQTRFVSHVFSTLLYALGKAGRKPRRFEVLLRHQPAGLPDSAFHLPEFTFPLVQSVLQNLEALFLTLRLSDNSTDIYHTYSSGQPISTRSGRSLGHFLNCTQNLTHLRLNFQKFQAAGNMNFMKWLAELPSAPEPPHSTRITTTEPAPVSFPHLKILELGQLDVHRDTLLAVLCKFAPTLKSLSLWRMTIESGQSGPYDTKPNIWSRFFRDLEFVPELELTGLKAGALSQDNLLVKFKAEIDGEEQVTSMREYSGNSMKVFIKGMVDDVVVEWPPEIEMVGTESDSNEDEDMDDDDDSNEQDEDEDD